MNDHLFLFGSYSLWSGKVTQDILTILGEFIQSCPTPTIILDDNLKIQTHNTCEGFFAPNIPAKSQPILSLFPLLKNELEACLKQNTVQVIPQIQLIDSEPDKYWDVSLFPIHISSFNGIAVQLNDITEKINLKNVIFKNDKLTSLGLLLAGIAHEINNPTSFVVGNIDPLKKDVEDLISIIKKYNALTSGSDAISQLKEIEDLKNELDVDYILQEIPTLLEGIKEGAGRIAILVKDLRKFARPDDKSVKKVQIQDLINSTLTLLVNSCKNRIEIVCDFGETPEIECIPGKINQVLLNLLLNAIQAIPDQGKIIITTRADANFVKISIKDNGTGISEENQQKLFQYFFTTKESIGTGLGLSITQSIIHEHGGTISFKSKAGEGTEFFIDLPIAHNFKKS